MVVRVDRVKEVTNTVGVGNYTLDGSVVGFRRFADALAIGSRCYYCAAAGLNWEVGQGVLVNASTLTRERIVASSNENDVVPWGAGGKQIFLTAAAETQLPRCNTNAPGPPGISNDETVGYAQGSIWVSNANIWVCLNPAADAAVWEPLVLSLATLGETEIQDLPAASALVGDEIVPLVQGGQTRRATAADIAALAGPGSSGPTYWRMLTADVNALINMGPTPQPWFPSQGTVAAEAGTYFYDGVLFLTHGTSFSHAIRIGISNVPGLGDNLSRFMLGSKGVGFSALPATTLSYSAEDSPGSIQATQFSTLAGAAVRMTGFMNIDAVPVQPFFSYTATPGGTIVVKTGTWFAMWRVGEKNTNTIGTWTST